jgi:hypothetical protein
MIRASTTKNLIAPRISNLYNKITNISGKEIRVQFSKEEQDLMKAQEQITKEFVAYYKSFHGDKSLEGKFKFLNNVATVALRTESKFKNLSLFVDLVNKFVDEYKSKVEEPLEVDNLAINILYLNTHIHNHQVLKAIINSLSLALTGGKLSLEFTDDPDAYKELIRGAAAYDTFTKAYENFLKAVGSSLLENKHKLLALKRLLTNAHVGDQAFFHILDIYMKFDNAPEFARGVPEIDDYMTMCREIVEDSGEKGSIVNIDDLKNIIKLMTSHDTVPYIIVNKQVPIFYAETNNTIHYLANLIKCFSDVSGSHRSDRPIELDNDCTKEMFQALLPLTIKFANIQKNTNALWELAWILSHRSIIETDILLLFINTLIEQEFLYTTYEPKFAYEKVGSSIDEDGFEVVETRRKIVGEEMLIENLLELVIEAVIGREYRAKEKVLLRVWDLLEKADVKEAKEYFINRLTNYEWPMRLQILGKFKLIYRLGLQEFAFPENKSKTLSMGNSTLEDINAKLSLQVAPSSTRVDSL